MTVERRYKVGIGYLDGGEMQKFAAANIAASIITEFTVRNRHVWQNTRSGVQHWREECPAGRRAHTGTTKLIPREQMLTKPCGHCAILDQREAERRWTRQWERVLAIEPPAGAEYWRVGLPEPELVALWLDRAAHRALLPAGGASG